jgi:hypothetical protein
MFIDKKEQVTIEHEKGWQEQKENEQKPHQTSNDSSPTRSFFQPHLYHFRSGSATPIQDAVSPAAQTRRVPI